MVTSPPSPRTLPTGLSKPADPVSAPSIEVKVSLLTGGFDRPYAFGLAMALASKGVRLDVIGSDDMCCPEMHSAPQLKFYNLRGSKDEASLAAKIRRICTYYVRLVRYAAMAEPKIFHILWNNKFQLFDRTLLMLYYRVLRKKIVFTAHNVNAGKRDSNDSFLNRLTLRAQYMLADQIFVHTEKMKRELLDDFGVHHATVIPFGINNSVPDTDIATAEAKRRLGVTLNEKTILFFGAIAPYKGLEYLVDAFLQLATHKPEYRLVIAGNPKKGFEEYWDRLEQKIKLEPNRAQIIQSIHYIPDNETELYFKAADVLVLPYTHVFQSGVLFLAYSFGLPVVASDVGSVAEDVIEGQTGFLCQPRDPAGMARAIEKYFESALFKNLPSRRREIREYANAGHSWETVADMTRDVYTGLLRRPHEAQEVVGDSP